MTTDHAVFAFAAIAALLSVASVCGALWVESILDPFNRDKDEK
jgi:hypothetical protein